MENTFSTHVSIFCFFVKLNDSHQKWRETSLGLFLSCSKQQNLRLLDAHFKLHPPPAEGGALPSLVGIACLRRRSISSLRARRAASPGRMGRGNSGLGGGSMTDIQSRSLKSCACRMCNRSLGAALFRW